MENLTLNRPYIMDEEEKPTKSLLDTEIKLKDVVQSVALLIGGIIFIVTMNAKIDALTSAINELKDNSNKQSISNDLSIKALQNQVSTQGVQISLMQKDIDMLKTIKK